MPSNQELVQEMIAGSLAAISKAGAVAHENFVTVNKALDLDFMEGKRMVGLTEAVGVREIASKSVPAGPVSPGA